MPSRSWSLALGVAAVACGVAAWIVWDWLALVLGLAFWVLLGAAFARHINRGATISVRESALAVAAREEAKLRELEASQPRRRHELVIALGLEDG